MAECQCGEWGVLGVGEWQKGSGRLVEDEWKRGRGGGRMAE